MTKPETKPEFVLPSWQKFAPALLIMLIISLLSVLALQALGGAERVRMFIAGAGVWAPLVFVLLKASTYVIAPLSGTPLKLAAGALFGVWDGLLYTSLGDILGGSLNFWIARWLGRPAIARFAGKKAIKQVDDTLEHVGGWRALLVSRLVLSALYDFISYAAGLSKLPYKHYLWVTIVGGIPAGLVYVFIGDRLTTGTTALYVLAGLIVVMSLVVWFNRKSPDKPV